MPLGEGKDAPVRDYEGQDRESGSQQVRTPESAARCRRGIERG
jgi:hypothetical protein